MKSSGNMYNKIFVKLQKEIKKAEIAKEKGNDFIDPLFVGYITTLQYFMKLKDKSKGYFGAQVILENWFLGEKSSF